MAKIAGHKSESGTGSISQRHGSADPDPYQNVMDHKLCAGDPPEGSGRGGED
jgi:hypothetical protein